MTRRAARPRKYVAIREKWAAALSMLLPQKVRDELRERRAPAKEVIGLFDQDHVVLHAHGGPDRWWNFTPMLRALHREKSRRDTSIVAKVDRVSAAHIREKWAAALSMLLPQKVRDELRERRAPAKEVIGLFDQDHVVLHAHGGPDRWWNFTPMLRALHREKSRRDTSIVAKVDRVSAAHEDFRRRVLAPVKRPRPKQGRKLQSRNDLGRGGQ